MIVSQARCGEALERRRIPRSRSDYLLASRLHATNRRVDVVRDEAGTCVVGNRWRWKCSNSKIGGIGSR
jgi:hypothetical protein